jgi:TatD DNase family protein
MIFDTHAHYDAWQYDEDREEVLAHLKDAGVEKVVNISNGWKDLLATLDLVEKYPWIYGTAGIHPCEIKDLTEERFDQIREFSRREKIVAIGEIGLDYYWVKEAEERENQRYWFRRQLTLAKEENLPVVIHSRDAAKDTFDTMKEEHAGTTGGIIHCYSGSLEMAREYVKLGYYLGIGGVVTFKNSKTLKRVAAEIPLEHIVLETDAPYLSPMPYRGKRNSSAYLHYVAEEIAALKGISKEEVENITYQNALKLYRIG